jgi:hypothetical protein
MLGRLGILVGALLRATVVTGASSDVAPATAEEDAIIRAALATDWGAFAVRAREVVPIDTMGPAWVLACSSPGFVKWPFANETDINVELPAGLLDELVRINEEPHQLEPRLIAQYFGVATDRDRSMSLQVSRPAISASGLEAVVGIAVWTPEGGCDFGMVAFLKKEDGKWVVRGFGCFWVT